jgi:hypothetical protein
MSFLVVLALGLPALFWPEGLETAPALRSAGIERFLAPPETAEAWRREGWAVTRVTREDLGAREALPPPGRLREHAELASATRSPWITANGWRMQRQPGRRCAYRLPAGRAALAAAEAFAYGADAVLEIDPADLGGLGGMLAFLSLLEASALPSAADFAVVDDGSPVTGEVMNLLARRNLLYEIVKTPSSRFAVNIQPGTARYPLEEAANPAAFALRIRREIGDDARSLRIYGSEVVLGRLTVGPAQARLHLLNYGGRPVDALRIRVKGTWPEGEAQVPGLGRVELLDHVVGDGATEFSLPVLDVYAVVDLRAARQGRSVPQVNRLEASARGRQEQNSLGRREALQE